jgi:lipid-binding SYLF domain-containing protein
VHCALTHFYSGPGTPRICIERDTKSCTATRKRCVASELDENGPLTVSEGLAVFQVLKAGFVFSGKAGSGLVIARLPDGSWSAPSCIATGGVGWGLQVGADITDFVVVLNSEDAVRAFSMGGNVTVGGNISAAAGPIGTGGSVQSTLAHPAPMFSYSKSKGRFGSHCYFWR